MNILEALSDALSILQALESRKNFLSSEQSRYDKLISNITHELELININACQGYKIAKKLQEICQERRKVKNELYELNRMPLDSVLSKLNEASKKVHKVNQKHEHLIKNNGVIDLILNGELSITENQVS